MPDGEVAGAVFEGQIVRIDGAADDEARRLGRRGEKLPRAAADLARAVGQREPPGVAADFPRGEANLPAAVALRCEQLRLLLHLAAEIDHEESRHVDVLARRRREFGVQPHLIGIERVVVRGGRLDRELQLAVLRHLRRAGLDAADGQRLPPGLDLAGKRGRQIAEADLVLRRRFPPHREISPHQVELVGVALAVGLLAALVQRAAAEADGLAVAQPDVQSLGRAVNVGRQRAGDRRLQPNLFRAAERLPIAQDVQPDAAGKHQRAALLKLAMHLDPVGQGPDAKRVLHRRRLVVRGKGALHHQASVADERGPELHAAAGGRLVDPLIVPEERLPTDAAVTVDSRRPAVFVETDPMRSPASTDTRARSAETVRRPARRGPGQVPKRRRAVAWRSPVRGGRRAEADVPG